VTYSALLHLAQRAICLEARPRKIYEDLLEETTHRRAARSAPVELLLFFSFIVCVLRCMVFQCLET